MLTVYIDFKSAASYLALEPTLALARELGVAIDWRPFRTTERRPVPTRVADASVTESHRAARERSRRAMDQHYAMLRGLESVLARSARWQES